MQDLPGARPGHEKRHGEEGAQPAISWECFASCSSCGRYKTLSHFSRSQLLSKFADLIDPLIRSDRQNEDPVLFSPHWGWNVRCRNCVNKDRKSVTVLNSAYQPLIVVSPGELPPRDSSGRRAVVEQPIGNTSSDSKEVESSPFDLPGSHAAR